MDTKKESAPLADNDSQKSIGNVVEVIAPKLGLSVPKAKREIQRRRKSDDSEKKQDGSTLRPVYGERRPVMYHLFETEMKSISSFNDEALRYFSFGGFLGSLFINIAITAIFAPPPLTPAEILVVRWGLTATGMLGAVCFGFAIWALLRKHSLINQIKTETRSDPKSP